MRRLRYFFVACCLATLFAAVPAQAELYKWTDAEGNVHYGDSLPENAQNQKIEGSLSTIGSRELGEVDFGSSADGAKKKKVVIYTTEWCGVCKRAKRYFKANAIPYSEYDVEKSAKGKADYRRMNGSGVPIILVDKQRMNGFSEGRFAALYNK